MKKWLRLVFIVLFVIVLAAVAGCSGKDTAETAGEPAGNEGAALSQKFIVASATDRAPFAFLDENTGDYIGFDMDLIKAIAGVNSWNYEIRSMDFEDIIPALESSSVEMAISAITITEKRKEKVNFSYPYYRSGQCVAVQATNEDIKGFDDLEGKTVGVQIATTGADEARKISNAKVIDYNTINDAFMALKSGNVDAVINDFPVIAYFIKQGNDGVKIVGDLKTSKYYGIAVPKDKPEILEQVNSALELLKENGKFDQIYKKWFGEEPPEYLPGEVFQQ